MSKTALITGASNGIGYELAKIHAEKGGRLVLVARNISKLNELKKELEEKHGVPVYTIEKDLSNPGAAAEIFNDVMKENIPIDFLINNAGFGDVGLFDDSDWNKQERMINLNVLALTHLTRLFLPEMIKRGSGRIMNVASTAAFQPGPTMSVYFATKAFVLSFSESVGNEVKDKGVSVTTLCPGSTESGFHAAAIGEGKPVKVRKLPSCRKIAEFGYHAMMKGKTVAIPGLKNKIFAGSVRFFPRAIVVKAARIIQEKKHLNVI